MKIEDRQLFPTTIMIFDLSDEVGDLSYLTENYQGTPHSLVENNGTSNYGTAEYGGAGSWVEQAGGSDLLHVLQKCVNIYADQLSLNPVRIVNSWMNHMGPGGKVQHHIHEGSVVSGAFYPKLAEGSVALRFNSPIRGYRMNDLFVDENSINSYYHYVEPKENQLVLFPSWLEHETETNNSEYRYVISFNSTYAFQLAHN